MDDASPSPAQPDAASTPDPVERMAAAASRDYDLSVADRLVRRPMPTLDIVNERMLRHFRVGLFKFIHRSAEISIAPVEVLSYADFIGSLAAPTSYSIMSMRPLRGSCLVVCEAGLVSTLVDALYGGACKMQAPMEGRDFSPTEQRVIQRLVGIVAADYNRAWKDIYPIELALQRCETHVQFVNVAAPAEKVVVTTLKIVVGDFEGAVRICLPYGTLDPIRDVLYGAQQAQAMAEDRRWVTLLTREIQAAEVTLVAELAKPEVTVGQLLAMKPGDFIQFDRSPQIVASVDGTPVFACHYGTHNARYALRIDESLRGDDPHWLGGNHVH
ncbi:MAG: flagellar motor switch protein FliM [Variovorax sp.]|jgi:flagellar motor switch protein FliM|nr:MAG: flagellar motor switch protein FliM [Variovorax sp.]